MGSRQPIEEQPRSSAVPLVDAAAGQWERMGAAPLAPRGGALPVWTGERLWLLGGYRHDEQQAPVPADACGSDSADRTLFADAAAWDLAADTWTRVVDPSGAVHGLSQHGDGAAWSGTALFTRSSRTTPDPVAGTLTSEAFDAGPALVYADPVWTGDRVVTVGWGSDGSHSEASPQVLAQVYDPVSGAVAVVPWPYRPPGAESIRTAWTGREVIAAVSTNHPPGGGGRSLLTMAFEPRTSTWRQVTDAVRLVHDMAWDGQRLLVVGSTRVSALDVGSGAVTPVADLPDDRMGDLLVSASGRVLLLTDRSHVLADDGGWLRVPDPPQEDRTTASTVAWAGDDLVVWGGTQAPEQDDGATRSTADGWVWRGLGARALAS